MIPELKAIKETLDLVLELMGEGLVSVKEAARLRKCSVPTIRYQINNGTLPFRKEGRIIKIKKSDLILK